MLNGKGGTAKHTGFDLVAATQSFAVMTAADKKQAIIFWAVLQDSDNPKRFVDNEILAIFANYPEGFFGGFAKINGKAIFVKLYFN